MVGSFLLNLCIFYTTYFTYIFDPAKNNQAGAKMGFRRNRTKYFERLNIKNSLEGVVLFVSVATLFDI